MKFNVKISRERTWFKRFQKKSSIDRIRHEFEMMVTEHERLAEHARKISKMLSEMDNHK